jgi:3-phenylpropionate/cinnamic acid dioxygenase small subunit
MSADRLARTAELAEVLYREARVLDDGDFDAWLAMLADDLTYVAPVYEEADTPAEGLRLTFFDENKMTLSMRVMKIRTGLPQTEVPASQTVRLVTNVLLEGDVDAGDEQMVQSAFLLHRHRRQRELEVLAGHRDDVWRRGADGWLLTNRTVRFAANVLPTQSLSLLY